jgi:hypothetical protein
MTVALDSSLSPSSLSKLIVVDIAPARGELSDEFKGYIKAMKKIEAAKVSNRKEALEILQEYEKVIAPIPFNFEINHGGRTRLCVRFYSQTWFHNPTHRTSASPSTSSGTLSKNWERSRSGRKKHSGKGKHYSSRDRKASMLSLI